MQTVYTAQPTQAAPFTVPYLYTFDFRLVDEAAGGLALEVRPDIPRTMYPTVGPEKSLFRRLQYKKFALCQCANV